MNAGRCLCGRVTWALSAAPFYAHNCHCKMCRKVHGTAFGTYYVVQAEEFRWTGETDSIRRYRSSPVFTRNFCDLCGAAVPFPGRDGGRWAVPAGGHDQGKKADCDIFVADAAPWFEVTGDRPRHDAYPAESGHQRIADEPAAAGADGTLRGSCLCGAVAFQVTEPLEAAYHCHCWRCRHARAAAHASNAYTSSDAVRFLAGAQHLKSYKPPEARHFTQVFCGLCGSAMPQRDLARKLAFVPLGALDNDPGIRPACHLYVAHKAGWHDITDDLPQFAEAAPA